MQPKTDGVKAILIPVEDQEARTAELFPVL